MDNAPKRADLDQIFDILLTHDNELAVLNAKLDELLAPVRREAESRRRLIRLFAGGVDEQSTVGRDDE